MITAVEGNRSFMPQVVSISRHLNIFWTKWNRSNLRLVFGLQKTHLGSKSSILKVACSCPRFAWLQSMQKQRRTAFTYFIFFLTNSSLQRNAEMLWPLGNTERCHLGRRSWISSKSMEFLVSVLLVW